MRRTIVLLVLLLGAAAPALAQSRESREHTQILAELRMLQEQQQRLQVTVSQLAEALKATNSTVAAQSTETLKGFANLQAEIAGIAAALPQLTSQLQQTRVDVGRVGPELDALREALRILLQYNAQIIELLTPKDPLAVPPAGTSPPDPTGGTPPPPPPATIDKPATHLPPSPGDFLQVANSAYFAGDFLTAIQAYQEFLKAAPTHSEAAYAQMQVGNSHVQRNEPKEAIAAFRLVTQNYPQSTDVADAYYSMGREYEKLKDTKSAISMYKIVTSKYPKTTAALRAEERLKGISKVN